MENQELVTTEQQSLFLTPATFEHAQRVAKMLSSSTLVPKEYQGNIQNTIIALEMAHRLGASPLMIMQNLFIVHGKPGWSSTFIIAGINSSKRFTKLNFELSGEGDARGCIAWATETGKTVRIESPKVTIEMAKKEGWYDKNGSKWKTMPELMLRYRSAAFFGRLHCPEITMGMQTAEEIVDVLDKPILAKVDKEAERILVMISDAMSIEELDLLLPHVGPEQMDAFNIRRDEIKSFS
jgi:hypothetical protein